MGVLDRSISSRLVEELFEQIQPQLHRILGKYRIPAQDGEDLVQQTFMALVHHWPSVRSPLPWVLGTLRRHCLMYLREQRRRPQQNVDLEVLERLAKPVPAAQEQAGVLREVERAVAGLPERCRTILLLRYGLGLEVAEVALRLGYRPSSIGKITHRCLEALHRKLVAPDFSRLSGRLLR